MTSKNYYDILGVKRDASEAEIKSAFRKLSLENHPDKQVGKSEEERAKAEARFKEIAEAYSILGNPEKRKEYDIYGSAFDRGGQGGGQGGVDPSSFFRGFNPFDNIFNFSHSFNGNPNSGDSFGDSSSFIPPVTNGRDIAINVEISILEQIHGTKKSFSLKIPHQCPECHGKCGKEWKRCLDCNGTGKVVIANRIPGGMRQTISTCPTCMGRGSVMSDPCSKCNGTGRVSSMDNFIVDIQPGITNGATIKVFPDYGEGGIYGGSNGSLVVSATISQNEIFKQSPVFGPYALVTQVYLTPLNLMVGGEVRIPTPDGFVTEKIKPGLSEGAILTIPNAGLAMDDTGNRGKIFAKVSIGKTIDIPEDVKNELERLSRKITPDNTEEFRHQKKKFDAIYGKS